MTIRISPRDKQYLETARTLLRAARTMTDDAIAGQLKSFADDYEQQTENISHVDAAKAIARSASTEEYEWHTWRDGGPDRPRCGAHMGMIVRFVPEFGLKRADLIREARAIYNRIFPPTVPVGEWNDEATINHAVSRAKAHHSDEDFPP